MQNQKEILEQVMTLPPSTLKKLIKDIQNTSNQYLGSYENKEITKEEKLEITKKLAGGLRSDRQIPNTKNEEQDIILEHLEEKYS